MFVKSDHICARKTQEREMRDEARGEEEGWRSREGRQPGWEERERSEDGERSGRVR